jgi:hypothetical protein
MAASRKHNSCTAPGQISGLIFFLALTTRPNLDLFIRLADSAMTWSMDDPDEKDGR